MNRVLHVVRAGDGRDLPDVLSRASCECQGECIDFCDSRLPPASREVKKSRCDLLLQLWQGCETLRASACSALSVQRSSDAADPVFASSHAYRRRSCMEVGTMWFSILSFALLNAGATLAQNNTANQLSCKPWSLLDTPNAAGLRFSNLKDSQYGYLGGYCFMVCEMTDQKYLYTNTTDGRLTIGTGANFTKAEKFIVEECEVPSLNISTTFSTNRPINDANGYVFNAWQAVISTYVRIRRVKAPNSCLTLPNFKPTSAQPGSSLTFKACDPTPVGAFSQLFRQNVSILYAFGTDPNSPAPPPPNDTRTYRFETFQHFQRPVGVGKQTIFNVAKDPSKKVKTFKYVISDPQDRAVSNQLPQLCIDGRLDIPTPYIPCD
ncbi:hypothetical protein V8E36_004558 [Tilletia maclaganii]